MCLNFAKSGIKVRFASKKVWFVCLIGFLLYLCGIYLYIVTKIFHKTYMFRNANHNWVFLGGACAPSFLTVYDILWHNMTFQEYVIAWYSTIVYVEINQGLLWNNPIRHTIEKDILLEASGISLWFNHDEIYTSIHRSQGLCRVHVIYKIIHIRVLLLYFLLTSPLFQA